MKIKPTLRQQRKVDPLNTYVLYADIIRDLLYLAIRFGRKSSAKIAYQRRFV